MKPFSFRLESVLNYRNYMLKSAQNDLFNARNEYERKEKEVERLAGKRMEVASQCSNEELKGIDVSLHRIYRTFLKKLDHHLEKAQMELKIKEKKVKDKEEVLKERSIKKKALESLKDLQLQKHRRELEREEQKVMDELAVLNEGGGI
ncbi:MAG: flagellar export protein FliJ [Thermodesulfobacteriota bacterium]|nr:flagellar export protein FliJ [Thermodesulfobacteriota bacterium]